MDIEPVRRMIDSIPKVLYLAVVLIVLVTVMLCCPFGG